MSTPTPRTDALRIYSKCPACHNDTLTINYDKHLLCTWINCPNPCLIDNVDRELTAANARIAELDRMSSDLIGEIEKQREEKESFANQLSESQAQLATSQRQSRASSTAVAKEITKRFFADDLTPERLESLCVALFGPIAAQLASAREDGERLSEVEANGWTLRMNSTPIADTGDYSSWWEVIEHHMAKPHERVIGSSPQDKLRTAIDEARGLICKTCKGYGFIPWTRGQTPESFEQGEDPCPDCTSPPASAEPGPEPGPEPAIAQDFCPNCGSEHYCTGPGSILEDGAEQRGCENCGTRWEFRLPPPTQDGKELK